MTNDIINPPTPLEAEETKSYNTTQMNYDVTVPSEYISNPNVTDAELRVYMVIRGFARGKSKFCSLRNSQIASVCGKTESAVASAIKRLKKGRKIFVDTRQSRIPKRKIFVGMEAFERYYNLTNINEDLSKIEFQSWIHFRNALKHQLIGFRGRYILVDDSYIDFVINRNGNIVSIKTGEELAPVTAKDVWKDLYKRKDKVLEHLELIKGDYK